MSLVTRMVLSELPLLLLLLLLDFVVAAKKNEVTMALILRSDGAPDRNEVSDFFDWLGLLLLRMEELKKVLRLGQTWRRDAFMAGTQAMKMARWFSIADQISTMAMFQTTLPSLNMECTAINRITLEKSTLSRISTARYIKDTQSQTLTWNQDRRGC